MSYGCKHVLGFDQSVSGMVRVIDFLALRVYFDVTP